jgi:hypothetical protein
VRGSSRFSPVVELKFTNFSFEPAPRTDANAAEEATDYMRAGLAQDLVAEAEQALVRASAGRRLMRGFLSDQKPL